MGPTGLIALVNFFAFVLISTHLGGDAINGHVSGGSYFVCGHGFCTQVTRSVWHYSYWHALATIGSVLLVLAENAYFWWTGDIRSSAKT